MADLILATPGELCLIQQKEDGRICQVAMTTEQHKIMQLLLGTLSKAQPFIQLGKQHDMVLKSSLNNYTEKDAEKVLNEFLKGTSLMSGNHKNLVLCAMLEFRKIK